MRNALRLLPFIAVAAVVALLPVYPVGTTTYSAWFGPPGRNSQFVNGTTFPTFAEILGGGLDWRTESGGCVTDGGGWSHYQADPLLIAGYAGIVVLLSPLLLWGLAAARTDRGRKMLLLVVAGFLLAVSSVWLVWYGLFALTCSADFGTSRGVAMVLAAAFLALGLGLLAFRTRLAQEPWRWIFRGSSRSS